MALCCQMMAENRSRSETGSPLRKSKFALYYSIDLFVESSLLNSNKL